MCKHAINIQVTSVSKSMLSILSASSITRNLRERRLKPFVFSRWSTRRPGVAVRGCGYSVWYNNQSIDLPMIMCGFLARLRDCVTMSTPPTITLTLTPIPAPKASNCSPIWNASSLWVKGGHRNRLQLSVPGGCEHESIESWRAFQEWLQNGKGKRTSFAGSSFSKSNDVTSCMYLLYVVRN